ncbi:hypothetical protein L4D09_28595 [Photobacterium makurazakiensis]|uniref:hypothetical protein n=1 Tax=Photobacterium makurazakiensis TaxID=2910234 RepID=UPI003D131928
MKIKHLSISSKVPERSAAILAELTSGEVKPFPSKTMENAWLCIWDEGENELIEFIPNQYALCYGVHAAVYERQDKSQEFNASHFMLEANKDINELARIADKHGLVHRFRARFGGPLYEVWLEDSLLVEFWSREIQNYTVNKNC